METKNNNIRYHYWVYDACPDEMLVELDDPDNDFLYSGFSRLYKGDFLVKKNQFTDKIRQYLNKEFSFKHDRVVTVAEDRETGEFAVAILHPKDEVNRAWRKELGRRITRGRLLKKLKQNGGNVNG